MMNSSKLFAALLLACATGNAVAQIPAKNAAGWQLLNATTQKPLVDGVFERMEPMGSSHFLATQQGRTGVLDAKGAWVIKPSFASVNKLGDYYLFTRVNRGLWGMMNAEGQIIADEKFDDIYDSAGDTIFRASTGNQFYVVNAVSGKVSDPYQSTAYMAGQFLVEKKSRFGVLSADIEEIIPCNFKKIERFGGNFILAQNKHSGLYDLKGKLVLDTTCSYIQDLGSLISYKTKAGELGFLDRDGNKIKGLENVKSVGKDYFIDWYSFAWEDKQVLYNVRSKEMVAVPKDHHFLRFMAVDSLPVMFVIQKDGDVKVGLMDQAGRWVVPVSEYIHVSPGNSPVNYFNAKSYSTILFNEGGKPGFRKVADIKAVKRAKGNEHTGFLYGLKELGADHYLLVDEGLQPVCANKYRDLDQGDIDIVAQDMGGKFGLINASCEQVIPMVYDGYDFKVWGFSPFKQGGEYHLYNDQHQRIFKDRKITGVDQSLGEIGSRHVVLQTGKTKSLADMKDEEVILDNLLSVKYDEDVFYFSELSIVIVETSAGTGMYSLTQEKYLAAPAKQTFEPLYYSPMESRLLKVTRNGKYNIYNPFSQAFVFETDVDKITDPKSEDVIRALQGKDLYILTGNYDHPEVLNVIKTDKMYEKARFYYDYDLVDEAGAQYCIVVEHNGKKGLLLFNGTWIFKPELDSYDPYIYDEKYMIVKKNKLSYLMRRDGTYFVQKGFDMLEYTGKGEDIAVGYIGASEYAIQKNGVVREL